jgi:hypothetical protein
MLRRSVHSLTSLKYLPGLHGCVERESDTGKAIDGYLSLSFQAPPETMAEATRRAHAMTQGHRLYRQDKEACGEQ